MLLVGFVPLLYPLYVRTLCSHVPVACRSVEHFLPLQFSSPLEHCSPDGFRPRGHSIHAFVLPCVQHSRCVGGPLSTLWRQLSCSFGLGISPLIGGSPRCALTLTMNVRAPRITLFFTHSMMMIVFRMSAFASLASVVRGPLPIHLDTVLSRVVSLSHK